MWSLVCCLQCACGAACIQNSHLASVSLFSLAAAGHACATAVRNPPALLIGRPLRGYARTLQCVSGQKHAQACRVVGLLSVVVQLYGSQCNQSGLLLISGDQVCVRHCRRIYHLTCARALRMSSCVRPLRIELIC